MNKLVPLVFAMVLSSDLLAQSTFFMNVSQDLYRVHPMACNMEIIGDMGMSFEDIALTPEGRLYGITMGDIYEIDTVTASTSLIVQNYELANSLVALNDSVLLTLYGGNLTGISLIDGTTWSLGNAGGNSMGDLVWFGEDLFLAAYEGRLVKISLNAELTAVDLLTLFPPYTQYQLSAFGLATCNLAPDRTSIIGPVVMGIGTYDLVCYSPIDGTAELICQLFFMGTPGAASFRPPITPLIGCSSPTAIQEPPRSPASISVADGLVRIQNMEANTYTGWTMTDAAGRVITSGPIATAAPSLQIDLGTCTVGAYTLQLVGPAGSALFRVMHQ